MGIRVGSVTAMDRRTRTLAALLVTALVLVPPAVAGARPSGPAPAALRAVEGVRMIDNAYRPRSISVPKGTRIRWTNRGSLLHSTTSTKGLWDSGLLDPGERFSRVFRRAGTFRYACTIHPAMTGRIVVT